MENLENVRTKIKTLKDAREILHEEYSKSDFHKKKESHPHSTVPSDPEDEEAIKLLTAINQLDSYVKKFQDEQFELIKKEE